MRPYRLTPAAEDDLFDVWVFIASDNPTPADAFQRLSDKPDLGHTRHDLTCQILHRAEQLPGCLLILPPNRWRFRASSTRLVTQPESWSGRYS